MRADRVGHTIAALLVVAGGVGLVGALTDRHRLLHASVVAGAFFLGVLALRYSLRAPRRTPLLAAGMFTLAWVGEQSIEQLVGSYWGSVAILAVLSVVSAIAGWRMLRGSGGALPPTWERVAIGLIVLVALALRLLGVGRGLPYIHEWDEPYVVSYVVGMLQRGDFDPRTFSYSSLYFYILLPVAYLRYVVLHLRGHLASPWAIQLFHPHAPFSHLPPIIPYWWYINAPSFYLWARVATSVIAAGAVYLTYRIGRATWTPVVGMLAAALLALAPGFIYYADTVRVDVPMVLFLCAAVLAGARILAGGTIEDYLVAGWFAGLAISTKQSAFLVVAPLLTAHALSPTRRGVGLRQLLVMGAAISAAFVAGTPRIVTEPRYLLSVWGSEAQAYGGIPTLASLRIGAAQNLLYFVRAAQGGESYVIPHIALGLIPVCAAALGAVVAAMRTPRLALYFGSFIVPYFCLLASQHNFFLRSMIPLLPFAALFAAVGADWLWDQAAQIRAVRRAPAIAGLGLVILLGQPAERAVRLAEALRQDVDTRTQAVAWVRQHARPGEIVAFDADLRWYLPAVRRLPVDVVYVPLGRDVAWYRARGIALAVVGAAADLRGARVVRHIVRPSYLGGSEDERSDDDGYPLISPSIDVVDVSGR